MILKKIISGMQTGADIAGVKAAKLCGLETGGWIPKGFITEDGKRPEYKELYGAQEHFSTWYNPRTYDNARDSDGTISYAVSFASPGQQCTTKACRFHSKPLLKVLLTEGSLEAKITPQEIVDWINKNNIQVLNVAGNRNSVCPGIEEAVIKHLKQTIEILQESE
jgi:hypothetical protein